MLSLMQNLIRDLSGEQQPAQLPEHQRQLACAALLIEVAHADDNFSQEELSTLRNMLRSKFSLTNEELELLIDNAQNNQQQATSLYEFTQLINEHCDNDDKYQLIESMWAMAYADNQLNKYEEHLIRRVAELIYVSHSDFIRAKVSVRPNE